MPEIDEKVMQFVEDTLKKTPKIQLDDLFEMAKKVSGTVAQLSKRQFNARYPLQVKRKKAQADGPRKPRKKKAASKAGRSGKRAAAPNQASREAVRKVLLQFATDIAGAEERKDLVKVLAGVDRYVDQVLKDLA